MKMALRSCCLTLLATSSMAVKQQVLQSDAAEQAVQTSAGFSLEAPSVLFRSGDQSGTVFLEGVSSSLAAREAKVEALAKKEQAALLSQQQALEVLEQQQKSAVSENLQLQATVKLVETKEKQMEALVQRQSLALLEAKASQNKAEAQLQDQSEALLRAKAAAASASLANTAGATSASVTSSTMSFLSSTSSSVLTLASCTAQLAVKFANEVFRDQLIGGAVYCVVMLVAAYIYGTKFTYEYPALKKAAEVTRQGFTFSLFESCLCGQDKPSGVIFQDARIPVCSCCCMPIRWADTASSSKINYLPFWSGVTVVTLMSALAGVTFYITGLMLTALAVVHRQRIRRIYGMPYGTCATFGEDCCTWTWCSCCATMQEAMEVEYIDPPSRPWQQSMEAAASSLAAIAAPFSGDSNESSTFADKRQKQVNCC